jgi:ribonucleoside-triphosphate reductase (thioredoxin)
VVKLSAELVKDVKLSESFLAQYRNKQPKWGFGGLGYIVYLRTYSRKKADGTLERWDETVQRITEGNFRIEAKHLAEIGKLTEAKVAELTTEMERFYHLVFNLVMTPPGRGLWMSGTEYAEKVGDAENNCWGVSMRPQPYINGEEKRVSFAPVFTFDQAMKGGGVGINIQRKYVNQIPKVENSLKLTFVCNSLHADYYNELDALNVITKTKYLEDDQYGLAYEPEDAREGWAEALGKVIDAHYEGKTELVIDISGIRPRGTDIKGFGGVASGPSPLVTMLTKVNEILNRRVNDYVSPTEWGDVVQLIGTCVVAGNVRRTALILIGDQNDKEYVESKNYSLPQNLEASQWRWASNNSVDISVGTDRETLRNLSVNIYYNGEPGYVNVELSRNYGRIIDGFQKDIDGEVEIFNPLVKVTGRI